MTEDYEYIINLDLSSHEKLILYADRQGWEYQVLGSSEDGWRIIRQTEQLTDMQAHTLVTLKLQGYTFGEGEDHRSS